MNYDITLAITNSCGFLYENVLAEAQYQKWQKVTLELMAKIKQFSTNTYIIMINELF